MAKSIEIFHLIYAMWKKSICENILISWLIDKSNLITVNSKIYGLFGMFQAMKQTGLMIVVSVFSIIKIELYANVTFNIFNNYFERDNGNRCYDQFCGQVLIWLQWCEILKCGSHVIIYFSKIIHTLI